jgi:hypothetical protein
MEFEIDNFPYNTKANSPYKVGVNLLDASNGFGQTLHTIEFF